jgi:predicted nucleotidyltransferase component of viral defense system
LSPRDIRNLAASVRQRLSNLAQQRRDDFQTLLTRYAVERLLYRLSQSPHANQFLLKGATLFTLWGGGPYRTTRDLDLLGFGDSSVQRLEDVFRDICAAHVEPDGLRFAAETVKGGEIREDVDYGGVRIVLIAHLERARIQVQVDIGFGDAVTPPPEDVEFPTILEFPAPRLRAYRRETVVAEKFQAMVMLGIANSRMRDFYDVWFLSGRFEFSGIPLSLAIRNTFARRKTALPTQTPLVLTPEFSASRDKQAQWRAFFRKAGLTSDQAAFPDATAALNEFLMPPTLALLGGHKPAMRWRPGGPWRPVVNEAVAVGPD